MDQIISAYEAQFVAYEAERMPDSYYVEQALRELPGVPLAPSADPRVQTFEQGLAEVLAYHDGRRDGTIPAPVAFGLKEIDAQVTGMERGTLNIIGARSGNFKSLGMIQIGNHVARVEGLPVHFMTAEMSNLAVRQAQLSNLGQLARYKIQKGTLRDEERAELRATVPVAFTIEDIAESTLDGIVASIRREAAAGVILFLLDYVQLVYMGASASSDGRPEELKRIAYKLRAVAAEENVIILAAAQLNREATAKTPFPDWGLELIQGSDGIGQAASIVLFNKISNLADDDTKCLDVLVAKNRNGGGTGSFKRFDLHGPTGKVTSCPEGDTGQRPEGATVADAIPE